MKIIQHGIEFKIKIKTILFIYSFTITLVLIRLRWHRYSSWTKTWKIVWYSHTHCRQLSVSLSQRNIRTVSESNLTKLTRSTHKTGQWWPANGSDMKTITMNIWGGEKSASYLKLLLFPSSTVFSDGSSEKIPFASSLASMTTVAVSAPYTTASPAQRG